MTNNVRPITPPGSISCMPEENPSPGKLALRLKTYRVGSRISTQMIIPRHLGDQIITALEGYDARITELIRANSREVVKRREINAHRIVLLDYVRKAADKFRFYGRQHRDKIVNQDLTQEQITATLAKSEVNDQMADEGDTAILFEVEPGAMGRP